MGDGHAASGRGDRLARGELTDLAGGEDRVLVLRAEDDADRGVGGVGVLVDPDGDGAVIITSDGKEIKYIN